MKKTIAIFSVFTVLFIVSALLYDSLSGYSAPEDELVYFQTPTPTAEDTPALTFETETPAATNLPASPTAAPPTSLPATAPPLPTQEPILPLPDPTAPPTPSSQLPSATKDFTVFNAAGKQISLSSLAGKPVVMNFWASWCTPCQEEMDFFQQAYTLYGSDIHFFMISIDTSQKDAQTFIQKKGYTFDIYFDSARQAQEAYSVSSVPQTYFIDRNGNIIAYKARTLSMSALINGISRIK